MARIKDTFALTAFALLAKVASASAGELKVTTENGAVLAVYNRPMIEELGLLEIRTSTPWTEGIIRFEGPSLHAVLTAAGAGGRTVTGLSFDDFAARITADMIDENSPIIATRMNGEFIEADEKGPFWIMFDFDAMSADVSPEMHSYSVWHLNELEVE